MQLHQVTGLPQPTLSISSIHYLLRQTRKIREAFPTTLIIPAPKRTKYENPHESSKQLLKAITGEHPTRYGGYGFHLNTHINYNLCVQIQSSLGKTD